MARPKTEGILKKTCILIREDQQEFIDASIPNLSKQVREMIDELKKSKGQKRLIG